MHYMARIYPLSGAFMIIALMGLIFSGIMYTSHDQNQTPQEDKGYNPSTTWAFTLMFLFGLMFIASIISMTYGPENALEP